MQLQLQPELSLRVRPTIRSCVSDRFGCQDGAAFGFRSDLRNGAESREPHAKRCRLLYAWCSGIWTDQICLVGWESICGRQPVWQPANLLSGFQPKVSLRNRSRLTAASIAVHFD